MVYRVRLVAYLLEFTPSGRSEFGLGHLGSKTDLPVIYTISRKVNFETNL